MDITRIHLTNPIENSFQKRAEEENPHLLFPANFELVESGFCLPAENMRFDEERAQRCADGAPPMFRLYGWNPWAVSLGMNQRESDIDADECARRGFHIVRRATGGRAVLHANEITYSVVMPLDNINIHSAYRAINERLLRGLERLGDVSLEFAKSQPDFRAHYRNSPHSVACFSSSARFEILHNSKKVVGSAQRQFGNILLQHGSILLDSGHEQLADVTKIESEEKRETLRRFIVEHTSTLSQVCGRTISYKEAAAALIEGFFSF